MTTKAPAATDSDRILRQTVLGSRRFSNYWWSSVVSIGGIGFLLAGLSSYYHIDLLPVSDPTALIFFPQGLAMGLYGIAAVLLSTYLWLTIAWDIGGGYNEFDLDKQSVRIFRWGFPGKNRRVEVVCAIPDVQSVQVQLQEGINPKRAIYLQVKGMREIPLTRVGQPMALAELETQAAKLARFLGVPLEGL